MTKEEALSKLLPLVGSGAAGVWVDALNTLGVLKFDTPEMQVLDRLENSIVWVTSLDGLGETSVRLNRIGAAAVLTTLAKAGFKVVRA